MKTFQIGDVTISSIVERSGPWRKPEDFFAVYDAETAKQHLTTLPPIVFDQASGKLVITYQTFVVKTPRCTVLIDTCAGDHKGYAAPLDYPKQPWLDGLAAAGLTFADITHVFCTHLHFDHTGWNTRLVDGRWVPTFPNAKYIFHKREYAHFERALGSTPSGPATQRSWAMNCLPIVEAGQALLVDDHFQLDDTFSLIPTPGHSPHHCCVEIKSKGQRAIVTGDLIHHALQCREPGWGTIFDHDLAEGVRSRRAFMGDVAGTPAIILPIHFPAPTAGHIAARGDAFEFKFFD